MDGNSHREIRWLVEREYGVRPDTVTKAGKLWKIDAGGRSFALKRIPEGREIPFFQNLWFLSQMGYFRFVPPILSRRGVPYVLAGNAIYYLMPWMGGPYRDKGEKYPLLFRELARLHTITGRNRKMDSESIRAHFDTVIGRWKKEMEFFERFLERCEQKWYLSPFEWQFLSVFPELKKAYHYAMANLKQWKQEMEKEGQMRFVFIHGKADPEHLLMDKQGRVFLISWEKSRFASPLFDILPLVFHWTGNWMEPSGGMIEGISLYMKQTPVPEGEKRLMRSYLVHPGYFFATVVRYQKKGEKNHEFRCTRDLHSQYRRLKRMESFVEELDQLEWKDREESS